MPLAAPITTLPAALRGQLWPRERLLLGLRVCKWLREQLLLYAQDIAFQGSGIPDCSDPLTISTDIKKFRRPWQAISVTWGRPKRRQASASRTFLQALRLVAQESSAQLCRLNLSSMELGSAGLNMISQLTVVLSNCNKLIDLHLARNMIDGDDACLLAPALANCSSITSINLDANRFKEGEAAATGLPTLLRALQSSSNLQMLSLSMNTLSGVWDPCAVEHWAPTLEHHTSLRELKLANTGIKIQDFQTIACVLAQHCTNLQALDCSDNELYSSTTECFYWDDPATNIEQQATSRVLSSLLERCTGLQRLSLSEDSRLCRPKLLPGLSRSLVLAANLTHLTLADKCCWDAAMASSAQDLLQSITLCSRLVHLKLAHCSIPWSADSLALQLAAAIAGMERLRLLSLTDCGLDVKAAQHVFPRLAALGRLRHLDVSRNCLGPAGLELLLQCVSRCAALGHLDVSGNFQDAVTRATDDGQAAALHPQNTPQPFGDALTHVICKQDPLACSEARYDLGGLHGLLSRISACSLLTHLDLSCRARSQPTTERRAAVELLLQALRNCRHLLHLDLSGVPLLADVRAVMAAVAGRSLSFLALSQVTCGPAAMLAIADGLASLSTLRHLDLSHNHAGPSGGTAICRALEGGALPDLVHLDVSGNGIGYECACSLSSAAWQCAAVVELKLHRNGLSSMQSAGLRQEWAPKLLLRVDDAQPRCPRQAWRAMGWGAVGKAEPEGRHIPEK